MPRPPESCDTGSEAQAETTAASAPTPQDRQGWDAAGLEKIQGHGPTSQDYAALKPGSYIDELLPPKRPDTEPAFRMVDFQEEDSQDPRAFNPWWFAPDYLGIFDDVEYVRQAEEFLKDPHTALGAASLVPGPGGAVASAADGVLYGYERDWGNAALSGGAAIFGTVFDAGVIRGLGKGLAKGAEALRGADEAATAAAGLDKAATAAKEATTSAESAGKGAGKAGDGSVAGKAGEEAKPLAAESSPASAAHEPTEAAAETAVNANQGARFGTSTTRDYKKTFFKAHPELRGKIWVHHAVEQRVLKWYPGVVTEAEMHSLENLRGIPLEANTELHRRQIFREWFAFYKQHPTVTKEELLQKATEIDQKYGLQFQPPVGGQK